MLVIKIPVDISDSTPSRLVIKFYRFILPKYKKAILRRLTKHNDKLLSSKLIQSRLIELKPNITEQKLFSKIIKYAVNHLTIVGNRSSEIRFGFSPRAHNIFTEKLTFDQLIRLLEFGGTNIKATNIFNNSMLDILDDAEAAYKITFKDSYDTSTLKNKDGRSFK